MTPEVGLASFIFLNNRDYTRRACDNIHMLKQEEQEVCRVIRPTGEIVQFIILILVLKRTDCNYEASDG